MASREVEWMKKRYQESSPSSDEGPSATKKVKFSEIEEGIRQQFPSSEYSHLMILQLVQEAFPSAEREIRVKGPHLCAWYRAYMGSSRIM